MAQQFKPAQHQTLSNETEYQIIRKDLRRVLILNAIYLIAILALFFTNKSSHYLDKWFSKILHF